MIRGAWIAYDPVLGVGEKLKKIEHDCEVMCEAAQIIHVSLILEIKSLSSAGPVDVECPAS